MYAPIAHRLGMRKVKEYMEDVSLKYLDPVAYKEIEDNLEARSTKRKQFIETTKEMIRSRVEPLIPGVYIEGRVKSVNGIYRKMFIQGKSFDEIYDVFALRVIVDTINDCYNVLGIIHEMFTPLRTALRTTFPRRSETCTSPCTRRSSANARLPVRGADSHACTDCP